MAIRKQPPFGLRIEPELKEWYKIHAKENNRSITYLITEAMELFKQHKEKEKKIATNQ